MCVKIVKNQKNVPELLRELRIAKLTAPYLKNFSVSYEPDLVETDKGPGLVCGLVCDADGSVSPPLVSFVRGGGDVSKIEAQLNGFVRCLIVHDIFFYDFNWGNLVVQTTPSGEKRLRYIDLKSLHKNGYAGFLKLEKFIAPFARVIMFRRIRREYRKLGLAFPFHSLCRKKFFSSLFVRVRVKKRCQT